MKRNNYLLLAVIVFSLMTISGCMSQKERMIKQGYPLSYADGFDDGCHSGKKKPGVICLTSLKRTSGGSKTTPSMRRGGQMLSGNVKMRKRLLKEWFVWVWNNSA